MEELCRQESLRPFDLATELPIRLTLLSHEPDHTLVLVLHHIVADGWSMGVLSRELVALYAQETLPDLAIQYADFALWQRHWLTGQVLQQQVDYWRAQLAGAPPLLTLPWDHPRPPQPTHRAEVFSMRLDPGLMEKLHKLSQASGATLFMTLISAFALLMKRYSGLDDVVLGSPVANRHRREVEGLIGFFVNTLALRFQFSHDPSFLEWLEQTRHTCLEAYAHQDLPFERLVEELNPERSMDHQPLVQVVLALQNAPPGDFHLADLQVSPVEGAIASVRMDLEVHLWESAQGLDCLAVYATDLFSRATIQSLMLQFEQLLQAVAEAPERRLSQLGGRLALASSPLQLSPAGSALELFESWARRTPDALALVLGDEHVTYGELDRRAQRVGRALQSQGVGPERRVGLRFPRSLELVVAWLGVWKAGGVCVSLDLSYPPQRLAFIEQDAALHCILEQLPSEEGPLQSYPGAALGAYLIYTSGSTGQPKGALNLQQNLRWLAEEMPAALALESSSRVMQFASFNFDASVWELLMAWSCGGALVIATREQIAPGQPLTRTLQQQRCTHVTLPPSALPYLGPQELPDLKVLVVAGEACPPQQLAGWAEGRRLINGYGPTEATICATYQVCEDFSGARLPIGKGWSFARVYVLDEALQPLPPGVPGELYIGGAGVARGYHGRAALTAERFLPDPFSNLPGARMYRSGDRVRQLADGSLDFLGRLDDQLKVRGYRIEPGEIEAVLRGHEAVSQALVVAHQDNLLAYVQADTRSLQALDWRAQQVLHWQKLYDETIQGTPEDSHFHIVGWNSSYSGEAIAAAEMRAWVEDTVERIRARGPFRRILEIGCGTGLLLCRLAPHCQEYVGLDFSSRSLAHVASLQLANVTLHQATAQDLPPGPFDLVILNSIIQYFPGQEYLEEVLHQAIERVQPGGQIFLGDVRNLELLEHYHQRVVELRYPHLDEQEKARRAQRNLLEEEELLVSPAFWNTLAEERLTGVQIWPKRGHYLNELNTYRYEVFLQLDRQPSQPWDSIPWQDWSGQLPQNLQTALGIRRVPNSRLEPGGLHPEEAWALGAEVSWASAYPDGSFDVIFGGQALASPRVNRRRPCNDPLFAVAREKLQPALRERVRTYLPESMHPAHILILEEFPLNATGKIDRRRLPRPLLHKADRLAPRGPVEEAMAEIWAEVLHLDLAQVGVRDNFFELGGHSLSATQVMSRISRVLDADLPLRAIFESPTIEELSSRLKTFAGDEFPLVPQPRGAQIPLSFAQERLWFLHQLTPDNPFYNMPMALRLRGVLDRARLRGAFEKLLQRHESLRTTFENRDGTPQQTIHPAPSLPWQEKEVPLESVEELCRQESLRPFDLAAELPIRLTLLSHEPDHTLVLVLHHIVADGWSMGVLSRELVALYAQETLPDLAIQYADFALWQRHWLTGQVLQQQVDYWRGQLAGAPPLLTLPWDHPRPPQPTHRAEVFAMRLDPGFTEKLHKLSQASGATLFMTLISAFALLMKRYSGLDDVVLGSPVANRHRREVEGLIGFFVNTLALRFQFSHDPSFLEWLEQTRHTCLEAYAHQDLPFERLVEELNPERSMDHQPLVQVVLALQNAPPGDFHLADLQVSPVEGAIASVRMDLEVHLWESAQGLDCLAVYATDLFSRATIQSLMVQFEQLLQAVAEAPERRLSQLGGRLALASSPLQLSPAGSALELFESWARRTPDALALVLGDDHVTYGELDRRAQRMGRALQSQGVGPERRVGLRFPRSLELVVAWLGVWKAGGVCVSLDPSYPPQRLAFIEQDAALHCILEQLPSEEGPLQSYPGAALGAYLIYTSGSTGQPKGALNLQQNIRWLAEETRTALALEPSSRVMQFASFNFDASVWELLMAWSCGGALVMAAREHIAPGQPLTRTLQHQLCTHTLLPPSTLPYLNPQELPDVKVLVVGGEACPPQHLAGWAEGRRLVNAYGPTEATICATYQICEDFSGARLPIGKSWSFARAYVLDEALQPLPPGVPGELYIGGAGVARGYHGRAALTAERFLPDPFSNLPGARMYRSGDRVRQLADGSLDFLGRLDDQLKVRGYRIEPGEIEAVLRGHEAVSQALVVAHQDNLLAYVQADTRSLQALDWRAQQVLQWQKLYEETIQGTPEDSHFHIVGWNSSYSGEAIPAAEMRPWVEDTVERIRARGPFRRILEIGCGTGLLLCRLAPHCQEYVGLDFSSRSLAHVASLQLANVTLHQATAQDLPPGPFDLVILNSIIQYFPGQEYLEEVLHQAIERVQPGGQIFLGDVRNLELLEHYHQRVVELRYPHLDEQEKARRAQRNLLEEEELLVSPAFWNTLAEERLTGVQIWPKRGHYLNELNTYRYEVFLQLDRQPSQPWDSIPWQDWSGQLPQNLHTALGIRRVPNSRLEPGGLHPEEAWALGAEVSWASAYPDGSFDVIFGGQALACPRVTRRRTCNDPLFAVAREKLQPALRERVRTYLPESMHPAHILILEEFPLNATGKIDRRRLPQPLFHKADRLAPRGPVEEAMAEIWAEVLHLDLAQVGVRDNFFELGGHSLSATQVMSRISRVLDADLPLRAIFESPTIEGLALRLGQQTNLPSLSDRPGPQNRQGPLPLSFAQERLWFMEQFEPGNSIYAGCQMFRVEGPLNCEAFLNSVRALVARHEVLRTRFRVEAGQVFQDILPPQAFRPRYLEVATGEEARDLLREASSQVVDLTRQLPFQVVVVRVAGQEHHCFLLLRLHHSATDGWSWGLLYKEMAILYRHLSQGSGEAVPLDPLPLQYADFSIWQRKWLGQARAGQVAYWKRQLQGLPELLRLPYDWPRPSVQSFRAASAVIRVDTEVLGALKLLSHESGVTLFMTLLAAFQVLLLRYSEEECVVVGSPIAGRTHLELEGLVGLFVNTLVLRGDLSGNPTFAQLLQRTGRMCLEAYAHQDLPFEALVKELSPQRSTDRHPLFQVSFALQNAPQGTIHLEGVNLCPLEQGEPGSDLDLDVHAWETPDQGLYIHALYCRDLFLPATIERMLEHFQQIVAWVARHPQSKLAQLEMITHWERAQLELWSSGPPAPSCSRFSTLWEARVALAPDSPALKHGQDIWSYAQLDAAAEILAQQLRRVGAGKDTVVAIETPRQPSGVAALLAVFKVGAAALPLDGELPAERRAFMLQDARATLAIDVSGTVRALGPVVPAPFHPEGTAYTIYTSGTTGRPKGVAVPHRALASHCLALAQRYEMGPNDVCLQFASWSFDVALEQLLVPLAAGACVVLRDDLWSPAEFFDAVRRHNISVVDLPPDYWAQLVDEWDENCGLRLVLVGGDVMNPEIARRWKGPARLLNAYGPTEATITSTLLEVGHGFRSLRVPIGSPLPGRRIYILDEALHPTPLGVPGELCIGGEFLARGYLNLSALTADRFVPDPFSAVPGARLYRTGDRARYLPDGTLEFLGRRDRQLKIRGYRVEAEEIEQVLLSCPGVREVAVLSDHQRLIAYLCGGDSSQVESRLRQRLPEFMRPSKLIFLQQLPRREGRLDVGQLPRADSHRPSYRAPANPIEEKLIALFAEVLSQVGYSGVAIGVDDNFFSLGGDSILALQVVARAQRDGLSLRVADVLRWQSVAELAPNLTTTTFRVPIIVEIDDNQVPLTPIQAWFFDQQFPQAHHHNLALGLEMTPGLEGDTLERAVALLVEHHPSLRLRFSCSDGVWTSRYADREEHPLVLMLSGSATQQEFEAALETCHTGFDLEKGPLVGVVYADGDPARLVLVAHHLAIDVVSLRILQEDLHSALAGLPLPAPTSPYQAWSRRLQTYADQVQFPEWLNLTPSPCPLDISSETQFNTVESSVTVGGWLNPEETRLLLTDLPDDLNIDDVLLAALATTWGEWTGQETLLVDLDRHGREDLFADLDLSRSVGWFTSVHPLQIPTRADNPLQLLHAVHQRRMQIPRQGIDYGILCYLRKDPRCRQLPVSPVSFNYLGQFDHQWGKPIQTGQIFSAKQLRMHTLELVSMIKAGQFMVSWTYSRNFHLPETMKKLSQAYLDNLRKACACITGNFREKLDYRSYE